MYYKGIHLKTIDPSMVFFILLLWYTKKIILIKLRKIQTIILKNDFLYEICGRNNFI